MTTNLLSAIRTQLTPAIVHHLSSLVSESPVNTQQAVDEVLPTLLTGVIRLSSSGDGPARLVDLINHRNYERLLNNLSGLFDKGNTAKALIASGQDILRTVFAGKLSAVSALIAHTTHITNASASVLLSLTAPLVVGTLGRVRAAHGLNAIGLSTLLLDQRDTIAEHAPAGLADVLELNSRSGLDTPFAHAATAIGPNEEAWKAWKNKGNRSGRPPWWLLLLGIVALSVVYWLWGRGPGSAL
ncbi:MAG: DUF937 domain-containing protein [Candidatus Binatia bacterium]